MSSTSRKGVSRRALVGLLAVSLFLAGCAVRVAPPAELPPEALEPDRWAADSTDESAGPVPTGWLAAFGDPQLKALVDEALAQNQNLLAAAAQLEVARQLAVMAGADLYPFIGLSASGTWVGGFDDEPTSDRSSVALGVSWEIDLWGGIRAGKAAATADYVSATDEYEFAMLSLAAQAALQRYVQAVLVAFNEVENALANETYLREAVGFQQVAVQAATDALRQARVQYDFGLIDFLSVIQIQEALVGARSGLLGLENQRLSNRISL